MTNPSDVAHWRGLVAALLLLLLQLAVSGFGAGCLAALLDRGDK